MSAVDLSGGGGRGGSAPDSPAARLFDGSRRSLECRHVFEPWVAELKRTGLDSGRRVHVSSIERSLYDLVHGFFQLRIGLRTADRTRGVASGRSAEDLGRAVKIWRKTYDRAEGDNLLVTKYRGRRAI